METKDINNDIIGNQERSFFGCRFILLSFISLSLPALILFLKFIFIPYWQEILFYVYISTGIILDSGTLIFLFVIKKRPTYRHELYMEIMKANWYKKPVFFRLRRNLSVLLECVCRLAAWPASVIFEIYKLFKYKEFLSPDKVNIKKVDISSLQAESLLKSPDLITSITILANILVVYLINYLPSTPWIYSIPYLIIMIIHILCRHLSYAINPITLPEKLRRTYGNPYLRFVVIAITDFLSLLLSFALIISIEKSIPMNFNLFKQIAIKILSSKIPRNITDLRNMAFIEILISLAGILYYLTLLKVVICFKEFKRTDDDYRNFAENFNLSGMFDKSINYLNKIPRTNKKVNDFEIETVCLVGMNQIDKAFERAELYLRSFDNSPTKDDIFSFVLKLTTLYNVPKKYFFNAIKMGISLSISDCRLYSIISTSLKKFEPPPYEDFENLFQKPEIKTAFPLSYSNILISLGRYQEAFSIINKIKPKSKIDRLIHHLLWIILQGENSKMTTSQKMIDLVLLKDRLTDIFKIAA